MKILKRAAWVLGVFLVALQFVPYGRNHSNPPVTLEPRWNSLETKTSFDRVCADCHSHQTTWPWYSHVAPVSWLVQRDVDRARAQFNVSNSRGGKEAHEAAEELLEGDMPPKIYLVAHPEARLADAERRAFAIGLDATFGPGSNGDRDEGGVGEKSGYLD